MTNNKGQNWVYVVGEFDTSHYLRYKVVNNRCYVEMLFENLTLSPTLTQFINDNTFPKPYGTVNRIGINGINTDQSLLVKINTNGGLLMGASTSGQYYPVSAFDYEIAP